MRSLVGAAVLVMAAAAGCARSLPADRPDTMLSVGETATYERGEVRRGRRIRCRVPQWKTVISAPVPKRGANSGVIADGTHGAVTLWVEAGSNGSVRASCTRG